MIECPYCGQPSMSIIEKLSSGPLTYRRCKNCRNQIKVSWAASLLILAYSVLMGFQILFAIEIWKHVLFSAIIIFAFLYSYYRFVPIVKSWVFIISGCRGEHEQTIEKNIMYFYIYGYFLIPVCISLSINKKALMIW